jgi:diguanylate cyclase (GGDEF)-like protein
MSSRPYKRRKSSPSCYNCGSRRLIFDRFCMYEVCADCGCHADLPTGKPLIAVPKPQLVPEQVLPKPKSELVHEETEGTRDYLTGLKNARSCVADLSERLNHPERKFAVLFANLIHFKKINERHGNLFGDEVLRRIGKELLERTDFGYRIGGNEFVVIVECAKDTDGMLASLYLQYLFTLVGLSLNIVLSARVGISVYPDDARTLEGLLWRADQDMYSTPRKLEAAS